jgi:isopenicillin N synthase-like dioxygenase
MVSDSYNQVFCCDYILYVTPGTITILRTDYPGLQVSKDKDPPQWVDVPFVPGAFIVNLGDLMHRWTGDKWLSTLHRVVNPSEAVCATVSDDYNGPGKPVRSAAEPTRRQSMAFFHNINRDAVVETLPSSTPVKQYDPIVAGDFLMMKHLASIGQAQKQDSK